MKNISVFLIFLLSSKFFFSQQGSFEKIQINRDNITLNGVIFPTKGDNASPALLLLRGFPGGESDVFGIGEKLQENGIITLTFNYSGTYSSNGKYSMEYTLHDIKAAFEFLIDSNTVENYHIDTTKIYLGGYSYGGGMSLSYAANHREIKRVFSIAGTDHGEFFREYYKNEHFAKMIDDMFDKLKAPDGPVRFEEGKMPKEITSEDVTQIDSTIDLRKCAPLLSGKKILLIAGLDDPMVTMENHMLPLYRALQNEYAENVKFLVLQDDHSFRKSREKVSEIILNWIKN